MARARKKTPSALDPPNENTWVRYVPVLFAFLIGVVVTIVLMGGFLQNQPTAVARQSTKVADSADLFSQLLANEPKLNGELDIARLNLTCALGLPGAEKIDVDERLRTLDRWADRVRSETERNLYQFRRDPANYENSEGYFRMLTLITVLQQDCGVHYNEQRIHEPDFTNSQDLFLHGMIDSDNGGTCVSMPVLYTAVARRLGYPVKLVLTRAHVFCRWDAPGERFNIEGAGRGMNSYPDEHYKTWPMEISDAEIQREGYLQSLTAQEELAVFLAARGHCLEDTNRTDEAIVAYALAKQLVPDMPTYARFRDGCLEQQILRRQRSRQQIERNLAQFKRQAEQLRQSQRQQMQYVQELNRQNQQLEQWGIYGHTEQQPQFGLPPQFGLQPPSGEIGRPPSGGLGRLP